LLAGQTAKSTVVITKRIALVQNRTTSAVDGINE
jgi:hypothetical protein